MLAADVNITFDPVLWFTPVPFPAARGAIVLNVVILLAALLLAALNVWKYLGAPATFKRRIGAVLVIRVLLGLPIAVSAAVLLAGLTLWTYAGVEKATRKGVALVLALRLGALLLAFAMLMRPSF